MIALDVLEAKKALFIVLFAPMLLKQCHGGVCCSYQHKLSLPGVAEHVTEFWSAGKLGDASGRELMDAASVYETGKVTGAHRRKASMADSDGSVHSFPVDLTACEWVEGSDGLQHMCLPLWMHPQAEGTISALLIPCQC